MENRRTILAVALSLAVLIGWPYFSEFMGWTPPKDMTPPAQTEQAAPQSGSTAPATQQSGAESSSLPVFTPTEGREVKVDTPLYTATFHSGGGVLKSFILKNYKVSIEDGSPLQDLVSDKSFAMAPMGLSINSLPSWSAGTWAFEGENITLRNNETGTLTFTGFIDGIQVRRELQFHANTFLINENVQLGGVTSPRSVRLGFKAGSDSLVSGGDYNKARISWYENGSVDDSNDEKKLINEGIQQQGSMHWGGVMSNYFMTVVGFDEPVNVTLKARIQGTFWGAVLEQDGITVEPGAETTVKASWWYGAKERALLDGAPAQLAETVTYGWFGVIARPLLFLLTMFHGYVGNWGVAIILLTMLIRVAFFPLSQKSYKSMEKMKKLQPMMQALREKHGTDRDTLNREVMQLYKTYGANPASGCLPILVQLPVFIGLYQALLNALELRHAVFIPHLPFTDMIWLVDLSSKDPLYISPILMGATMFLQQKMSPPIGEPLQQKIMLAMPIIFTFMFLQFPAGLVIYWFFNNLLSIAQQWLIMSRASK